MPRALDPTSTKEVVLLCDRKGRKDKRPTFIFMPLSAEEWKRIANLQDNIDQSSADNAVNSILDPVADALVGWRNMIDPNTKKEIPFNKKKLAEIVTFEDAVELMQALLGVNQTSGKQLGNSASPSSSSTGSSARHVRRAGAKTARQSKSR